MKAVIQLFLSFIFINYSIAQTKSYRGFSFLEKPVLHTIEKQFETESAIYVRDGRMIELIGSKEGIDFYSSYHKIIRVTDEKGIENFNKIYIPVSESVQLMQIKARAITPGNKVIEVKPDAIKDYTDEENNQYKIFAIDGLSKGSEIEYTYTVKRQSFFFGKEIFQFRFPVQEAELKIFTPSTIKFEARAFNTSIQTKEVVNDEENQRIITFIANNIESYQDEKYAMVKPALVNVQYKLSYTQNKGMNVRLFTWSELAQSVYETYNVFSKKEKEVAEKFLKKIELPDADSEEQKIRKIENYIKLNVKTGEDVAGYDFEDFGKILQNKIATNKAIGRLMCALFQKSDIKFEVVITGSRDEFIIEKAFENWNNAQNIILHFPALKKFIAPASFLYRYPFIPPSWAGANALYCIPVEVGEMKSALAEVKGVPMEAPNQTLHNLESVITFNQAMDTVFVQAKHIHSGYSAPLYKAQMIFLSAEDQKLFMKETARNSAKTETILSQNISNKELEITEKGKPFIMDLKLASVDLLEMAGNKILLKVGECIGPQAEMYNERERQFNIEIDYPHWLERKLTIEIPAGYKIKNPDDLNFNISYSTNDKITMAFLSSYTITGNKLEIVISEQYNQLRWSKSEYENFVKVINASADFNKVVLVFEKM